MARRGAVVAAALAVTTGVLFNLPAQAQNEECEALQEAYLENPDARPTLLRALQAFNCTVPIVNTTTTSVSSSSSTSSSSSSTTSTTATSTPTPASVGCASLTQTYNSNVAARPTLIPLMQAIGCPIPGSTTSSTSSTSTSTSSTSTSSTSTTSTTVVPTDSACPGLLQIYSAVPETRAALLPLLLAEGCTVPTGGGLVTA